jgi:peptidoglycan DL-endopeptidase CwlO
MAMHMRKRRVSPGAGQRSPLPAAARPIAWSALISSIVLSIAVGPAYATPDTTPGSDQVPNTGVRPVADRPLQLPGAVAPATVPGVSSLAQQLQTKQAEMEQAGEQAKQANLEHASARTNLALADRNWRAAGDRLNRAQTQADADAAAAYKATAGLPPQLTSDLQGFGALSAVTGDDIPGIGSARELLRAKQEEHDAYQAYLAAVKSEQAKAQDYLAAQAEYKRRETAYLALRQQNADKLAAAELEQERRDQALGRQYIDNGSLNGFAANAKALNALKVALAQLGKPYVWGAEGPNSFDCSGLMWYSYLHGAGYNLPRVAKDQYYATQGKAVSRYALLPGDLLFFATNPNDWTTVHHVGMYLGNGKMVHAPHTGDVVKVSTVWWSEFFAATRVFTEAVSSPAGNGSTPPAAGGGSSSHPTPSPTPSKTASPSPSKTASPSPSKTASPSPSKTASPTPTESPSPTPDPTTGSPTPAESDSQTPSGGDTSTSADPSGSDGTDSSTSGVASPTGS